MEEEQILTERKEKLISFLKRKYNWLVYIFLALIIWLAVYIRTLPMKINSATGFPGLWDITRNNWTLGPDLDPFLFLRWAKDIVANGTLMAVDTLRYIPLYSGTKSEMILLPYSIAWFHELASFFGSKSVEYSAVIFPVFMFALTLVAFFLLVQKIFVEKLGKAKAGIIALMSSFFLAVLPALLPRTIAGIPEKESEAFFFLFLAFYFFLSAWKAKKQLPRYLHAILAGISTAAMGLIWGGVLYIFLTLSIVVFLAFFLGQLTKEKFFIYSIWMFTSFILMPPFSSRYSPSIFLTSTTTLIAIAVFGIFFLHFILFETKIRYYIEDKPQIARLPKQIVTMILFTIIGTIAALVIFGPSFFMDKLGDVSNSLITPVIDRFGVTVAENRQPYFAEWAGSFGPSMLELFQFITGFFIKGSLALSSTASHFLSVLPIFFWLFFFGSVYLIFILMKDFNFNERVILTLSYTLFLICLIFSRYSSDSSLNGTNSLSIFVYILGFVILISAFGYYYFISHKKSEEHKFKQLDFSWLLLFVFFFLSIVSARGSVRTIMVLVPSASIFVSYFAVSLISDAAKVKDKFGKVLIWGFAIFIILSITFSGFYFYQVSSGTAQGYIPSSYTQQWQKAMEWVRNNTPQNAVFSHWWDYGYWVQTMGERATVLDGGNYITYWDHLMGRHALTSTDNLASLDFLYSHNTTHFLIDSTDIGKYGAFSSIGSDINYDRRSWISTFLKDDKRTQETKNSTIYMYSGGTILDDDIIYKSNGSTLLLPAGNAGIAAVTLEFNKDGNLLNQPTGIFVYQGKPYALPLRYAYVNKQFTDFGSGVESGIFAFAQLIQDSQGFHINKNNVLLYLSNRTVKSQLARLYLYNEDNPYFRLVHTEESSLITQLKAQTGFDEDFVFYGDLSGPIKIWEVNYPGNMKVNPDYLRVDYPDKKLQY